MLSSPILRMLLDGPKYIRYRKAVLVFLKAFWWNRKIIYYLLMWQHQYENLGTIFFEKIEVLFTLWREITKCEFLSA